MEVRIKPGEAESALNRLTGSKKSRHTKESVEWRLLVRSSDGEDVAIRLQVNMHRNEVAKAAFNDLADRLRIDRKLIHSVLSDWSHDQIMQHLQGFTAAELREPAMRRFRR